MLGHVERLRDNRATKKSVSGAANGSSYIGPFEIPLEGGLEGAECI